MSDAPELCGLAAEPQEEWRRMLRFVGWDERTRSAAARSAEALLRSGSTIVMETYDYLRRVPETAAILGWEQRVDEAHLEERRRFFTIWLARTLGLDTSDEFAHYLFRAGTYHAGYGPRRIHTPSAYVTGSIGLVLAAFSSTLCAAELPAHTIAEAMSAWSTYLSVQLNQMLYGYHIAQDLKRGAYAIHCTVYGRLRPLLGGREIQICVGEMATTGEVLRKFFNYVPQARAEALERVWHAEERSESLWVEVVSAYTPRLGWRVLLNGRDLAYSGGFDVTVRAGDAIAIFPPGR